MGHAGVHIDLRVARAAIEQGLPPSTLSTDMVRPLVARRTYDLPGVMSTFLALGMTLPAVIQAVTAAPARAVGQAGTLGTLAAGAAGDAAVLAVEEGEFAYADAAGNEVLQAGRGAVRRYPGHAGGIDLQVLEQTGERQMPDSALTGT